jgi:sugar phosphate permease
MAVLSISKLFLVAFPALTTTLIGAFGDWRAAYRLTAVIIAAFLVAGLLLLRDTPQSAGLLPDGDPPADPKRPATENASRLVAPLEAATFKAALVQPLYYLLVLSDAIWGLFWTAFNCAQPK